MNIELKKILLPNQKGLQGRSENSSSDYNGMTPAEITDYIKKIEKLQKQLERLWDNCLKNQVIKKRVQRNLNKIKNGISKILKEGQADTTPIQCISQPSTNWILVNLLELLNYIKKFQVVSPFVFALQRFVQYPLSHMFENWDWECLKFIGIFTIYKVVQAIIIRSLLSAIEGAVKKLKNQLQIHIKQQFSIGIQRN